ncbi:MAG: DNA alkylation repair protein [Alphaproteobacteria bacterium]|nr:DNA alkylation repair protein [Alphaproteobacteria bacterium]MCB9698208.1 DNA alkylation repair protein [Alphaproteobacteria bacterium]
MDASIEVVARISARLEGASTEETARRYASAHRCLRGIRGVPMGDVARIGDEAAGWWHPSLPDDGQALSALFGAAWEDGLVAVGLLASTVAATPSEALALGLEWAERTDDPTTADALGWLVVGPAVLALGEGPDAALHRLAGHPRAETRRVAVAMALAGTPLEVEGAAAAPLRAALDMPHLRVVDELRTDLVRPVVDRFVRDVALHKPLRRLIRVWAVEDPASLLSWAGTVRGGLPAVLGAEVKRVRRGV